MNTPAEIETTVTAFVADLAELVRKAALESIRQALGDLAISHPATSAPPRPARPRRPARPPAAPPPATASAPAPPRPAPPVVVRRFPPKKQRRASAPPIVPTLPAAAPEQVPAKPAKSWVVARRPARGAELLGPGATAPERASTVPID